MTKDDIIDMARESELLDQGDDCGTHPNYIGYLERFANFVAAHEREACALVCDEQVDAEYDTGKIDHNEMGWTQACAIAIRARSQS